MGSYTQNLNLYKTDMETDGEDYFDFDKDLGDNWDKIDAALAGADIVIGTGWQGSSAPFTQEITVEGMTSTRNPSIDVVKSTDFETARQQMTEFSKIYAGFTSANKITFYATEPTTINLPLKMKN